MRHLTALRGGSGGRQRLGVARSGVGHLRTVPGTVSTWGLNEREVAARSSNLATASARPLVTLTTDPCRLATYGRGNRVAAPPPHNHTPDGHRSGGRPDAAGGVGDHPTVLSPPAVLAISSASDRPGHTVE